MKLFKKLVFIFCLAFLPLALFAAAGPEQSFKLTDEDIKMLNLNENEAKELTQFFDALNTLTPAQKKELEDIGRATEEKMKAKNLDPANFDDLMKFMEEEGGAQKPQPAPPAKKIIEEPLKPIEKPTIVAVTSPRNALTMLEEIEDHLASLRTKAVTRPRMNRRLDTMKLELQELSFYIPILKDKDLLVLLTSKESIRLYSKLETLHKAIMTYEPSIIPRTEVEDNPYEILNVSYLATTEEINEAYNMIVATQHPDVIKKELEKRKMTPKLRKTRLKAATRSFDYKKTAYDILMDPKKREALDSTKKIEQEKWNARASLRAFDRLFYALNTAIYSEGLLNDIAQLLAKHKPQELAQAQAQLEVERKVWERQKQVIRVPQVVVRPTPAEDPYAQFYQKMAQEAYARQFYPMRNGLGVPQRLGAQAAPTAVAPAAPKAAAPAAKKPEKKDDKKEPEEKKAEKEKVEAAQKIRTKTVGQLATMREIESILKAVPADDTVKRMVVRTGPGMADEEKEQTVSLTDITKHVYDQLRELPMRSGIAPSTDGVEELKQFADTRHFDELAKALKKLDLGKGKKIEDKALLEEWKERVYHPYGKQIEAWYTAIHGALHAKGIPTHVRKQHALPEILEDPWAKPVKRAPRAPAPSEVAVEGVNLGKIRSSIGTIKAYFDNISRGVGINIVSEKPSGKKFKEKKEEE